MKENREYVRYDKQMKIEYSFSDSNLISNTCGKVYNISLGGLYMVTELLVEVHSRLDLVFSLVKDDELIILKTTGRVLRSGSFQSDLSLHKKFKPAPDDGTFFAVVQFSEPFIELSFLLH